MTQPLTSRLTEREYLALERESDEKYEFVDGHMVPLHFDPVTGMAGASREHHVIVGNVITALGNALRAGACEVYPSDMRIRALQAPFYYPDASVSCSPIIALDELKNEILQNPTLIVEVLSPSTESRDRGEKAHDYRQLESCTDYLIVSSRTVLVEHQHRSDQGWRLAEYGPGQTFPLSGLAISLSVDELYLKVFR
jgi:Uma2 family endonuclease